MGEQKAGPMTQIQAQPVSAQAVFEVQARDIAQRVRRTLADLLAGVGADPTKPQAVARQLGLDKNLAWKASRIVTDEDPLASIPRVPGRSGQRILLDAFAQAGASKPAIDAAREAMADVERMVETHAGNRETFEMMLAALSPRGQAERDEATRRLSFQGNSATWGVQARVHQSTHFLAPSGNPDELQVAIISGLVDLRRLRANAPWTVAWVRSWTDQGALLKTNREPLDPRSNGGGPPLLRDFCSEPLPTLRERKGQNGVTRYEIMDGEVGNTGVVTCVNGWFMQGGTPRWRQPDDHIGEHNVALNTPVEMVIHDLYVHRSLDFAMNPEMALYSQLPGGPVYPFDGPDLGRLPIADTVMDLGSPPDLTTPELPKYPAMVELALSRLGFPAREFRGFRVKLRYPPIPSMLVLRFPLPARPDEPR